MPAVKVNHFNGGQNMIAGHGTPVGADLAAILRAVVDDMVGMHTAITDLTAKMDTDFTGQNGAVTDSELDVNYASTIDPDALTVTKG